MKKTSVMSFRTTITLLNRADSLTPMTRSHVIAAVMTTARRLQTIGIAEDDGMVEVRLVRERASGPETRDAGFGGGPPARTVER